MFRSLAVFFVVVISLNGCSKKNGSSAATLDETVVFGKIVALSGAAVSGATVSLDGQTTTTDANGEYRLNLGTSIGSRIVHFRKEGFLPSLRRISLLDKRASAAHAVLVAEAATQNLDATAGGQLNAARGASVVVPADALVDGQGNTVAGTVDVHLTPIDPSVATERDAFSGDLIGDDASASTQLLESFGMVDITVRQNGETLQVAPNKKLTLEIPPPTGVAEPPATMPLWAFDEDKGRWVEEGTATYDATKKMYTAEVAHMSAWNVDRVAEGTCITGLVKDTDGRIMAGVLVSGSGKDYTGSSTATTNDEGRFYLAVRKNSEVAVLATHKAGGGQVRDVMSGGEDTDVPPTERDPRCLDVGEWAVEEAVFVSSSGETSECDFNADKNPFAGGCLKDIGAAFSCFRPSGDCVIDYAKSPPQVRYGNGAKINMGTFSSGGGSTGTSMIEYFGEDGSLCSTLQIEVDSTGSAKQTISDSNGQSWTYSTDVSTSGDVTVTCPDGSTETMSREQQQKLQACQPQQNSQSSSNCTIEGVPGACQDDNGCQTGQKCCPISGNTSFRICIQAESCPSTGT